MKKEQKQIEMEFNTFSIKNDELFKQKLLFASKHEVKKKYLMKGNCELNLHFLANNNVKFIVGEKNSLLFKTHNGKFITESISNVLEFPDMYNIVVPIPYRYFEKNNYSINNKFIMTKKLTEKEKRRQELFEDDPDNNDPVEIVEYEYSLTEKSGLFMGELIDSINNGKEDAVDFVKIILDNPEILYSTNKSYIRGILLGLKSNDIIIKEMCCSYLGLPYKITDNDVIYNENDFENIFKQTTSKDYHLVNTSCIDFIEIDDSEDLYDFSTEHSEYTNYSFPFSPILKNSDGDVLAVMALQTKQGAEDAKKFSPESKEYFRSMNDGSIINYIADDAILGLFNATNDTTK